MNERKAHVWFALFTLAVFCTGAGAGLVMGRLIPGPLLPGFLRPAPPPGAPGGRGGPGGPGGGMAPHELVDRLTTDLGLSAEQHTQLRGIMESRRAGMEQIQQEVRARFDAEQQALRADIRKILTADQQTQFETWLKQWMPADGRGGPAGRGRLGGPGGGGPGGGRPGGPPPGGPGGPGRPGGPPAGGPPPDGRPPHPPGPG